MKYCFVVNPAAGKGIGVEPLCEKIKNVCTQKGLDHEIYLTKGVGDATDYVIRTATNTDKDHCFYACGGDGTLCEVVLGAMRADNKEHVSVGLIPVGTGNDFVRNFSDRDNFFDIDAQTEAERIDIDLLRCNDMYAVNMVNIGFDCEVVVKTAKLKNSPLIPSKMAYIAGLVVTLIRKPGVRAKFSIDGSEPEHHRYLLNTYANGSFCGGGFHSNPEARLSDGQIDVLLVNNISRIRFVALVGDYKKGTHLSPKFEKILVNKKAERVDIVFDKETNICVDGEVVTADELHLSVCRNALRFLVPRGCTYIKENIKE